MTDGDRSTTVRRQQVLGRFNSFFKSVILRVSEARDPGDFDRFAFYDHMKSITAAPPRQLHAKPRVISDLSAFMVLPRCRDGARPLARRAPDVSLETSAQGWTRKEVEFDARSGRKLSASGRSRCSFRSTGGAQQKVTPSGAPTLLLISARACRIALCRRALLRVRAFGQHRRIEPA